MQKNSYLLHWICDDQRLEICKYLLSVTSLYVIVGRVNGYFRELSENRYLTLVPTNEIKELMEKYEELLSKIRELILSITKNSHHHDKNYMKFKFNLNDDLPLNKMLEICSTVTVVTAVFHENNKYHPQESLHKL